MGTPDVDLSDQSIQEMRYKLGELAQICLKKDRVAIYVLRDDGIVTIVNPEFLKKVDQALIAEMLLDAWDDSQIEEFLVFLETKEERYGQGDRHHRVPPEEDSETP